MQLYENIWFKSNMYQFDYPRNNVDDPDILVICQTMTSQAKFILRQTDKDILKDLLYKLQFHYYIIKNDPDSLYAFYYVIPPSIVDKQSHGAKIIEAHGLNQLNSLCIEVSKLLNY
jgi:hypothetical protein